MTQRHLLSPILLFLAATLPFDTVAEDPPLGIPIAIEADRFFVYFDEEKAVWEGNVKARQGNYTFNTSMLTVYLEQVLSPEAQETNSSDSNQSTTTTGGYLFSAESLTYDLETGTVSGLGGCELRRGQEAIVAEKIVYMVDERRAVAEPDADGRVHVQFFSNPKQPIIPSGLRSAARD